MIVQPFHNVILAPIYQIIKNDLPCLITHDVQQMIAYQPHIIVLAEHPNGFFHKVLPGTIVIHTRHGFASKNYLKYEIRRSDFFCVSSEWVRNYHAAQGWFPRLKYWVTGFPAMDKALQTNFETTSDEPTLLYAPTFTPQLNAIEVLGFEWFKSLRLKFPNLNILIKLHPHIARDNPDWTEKHKNIAQHDHKINFIEANDNIYNYMKDSDILVTDASSVMFFYLAFNRPIILVNNPQKFKNHLRFDEQGVEWQWRNIGIEVDSVSSLLEAIEKSLTYPEEKAKQRTTYREKVFGNLLDGNAAVRIANKIRALAQPSADDIEWVQITWNSIRALGQLQRQTHQLQNP